MPSAQRTILITSPPEQVFAFFTDTRNDQRWRPHVKEVGAEGPVRVGSTVHQVVAGPGGRGIPADLEVTAYEPPSGNVGAKRPPAPAASSGRYAFKVIAGPVRPVGEFRFTPSQGGTEVSFSLNAEFAGIKKLLMSKAVQKSMDGEMASLDKAKALIEHG
jgi:uncharacterized protein YndB with AHSA1/START domain